MLLERGMAKEALAAFEATLTQGAEPARRHARRREGGGKVGRRRQSARALRGGSRAHRGGRSGPPADRAGSRFVAKGAHREIAARTVERSVSFKSAGLAARADGGAAAAIAGYLRACRAPSRGQGDGRHSAARAIWTEVSGRSPSTNGERAARLPARRPTAAPMLSSICVPSSAPAIAAAGVADDERPRSHERLRSPRWRGFALRRRPADHGRLDEGPQSRLRAHRSLVGPPTPRYPSSSTIAAT